MRPSSPLRSRFAGIAAVVLAVLGTASEAPALTLCIAPCDVIGPPPPTPVIPPPIDLPPFDPPSLIVLAPEGGDFELAIDGDLRILFSGSVLDAELLEVRSDTSITLKSDLSITAAAIEFCAPDCVDPSASLIHGAPGQISIQLPASAGALRLWATGDITILAGPAQAHAPVPEPTAAVLFGLGCLVVSGWRRMARGRAGLATAPLWCRRDDRVPDGWGVPHGRFGSPVPRLRQPPRSLV